MPDYSTLHIRRVPAKEPALASPYTPVAFVAPLRLAFPSDLRNMQLESYIASNRVKESGKPAEFLDASTGGMINAQ